MAKDTSPKTKEELIEAIQNLGAEIDKLKALRKEYTVKHDELVTKEDILAKFGSGLSDEQVEQISSVILAPSLTSKTEAK